MPIILEHPNFPSDKQPTDHAKSDLLSVYHQSGLRTFLTRIHHPDFVKFLDSNIAAADSIMKQAKRQYEVDKALIWLNCPLMWLESLWIPVVATLFMINAMVPASKSQTDSWRDALVLGTQFKVWTIIRDRVNLNPRQRWSYRAVRTFADLPITLWYLMSLWEILSNNDLVRDFLESVGRLASRGCPVCRR